MYVFIYIYTLIEKLKIEKLSTYNDPGPTDSAEWSINLKHTSIYIFNHSEKYYLNILFSKICLLYRSNYIEKKLINQVIVSFLRA